MSQVKLHLPFYTKKILLKMINLMNNDADLLIKDVSTYKVTGDDLYNKIGEVIFNQSSEVNIFLLGDTNKLRLPLPCTTKILIKDKIDISDRKKTIYTNLGYKEMTEAQILKNLDKFLTATTTHICEFDKKNGKIVAYDVYRLWFEANKLKPITYELTNIFEYTYGITTHDEIKRLKLWGSVTLDNLSKYPDHINRINNADLTLPIIMTMYNKEPKLLDGLHRLVKAYLLDKKTVKVIILDKKHLKYAEVN